MHKWVIKHAKENNVDLWMKRHVLGMQVCQH
jgi:hypothetical protein